MDDIAEKIKAMLSDPEGVEKIMGIAKALGENSAPPAEKASEASSSEKESADSAKALLPFGDMSDNPLGAILKNPELKRLFGQDCKKRNVLLKSLCPFLSQDKQTKLEKIIKATSTIEMLYSAGSLF